LPARKELARALNDRNVPPEGLKAALGLVADAGRHARGSYGALRPPPEVPLSGYAGGPARARPDDAEPTPPRPAEPLPAENVAALGRTLFSDHLLAVELAGTLLLVATIGTIAIAGRRPEGRA
jgi:hypothetical protein